MAMLSTLSSHGTLAAGTSGLLAWNIVAVAIFAVAGVAIVVWFKKG